MVVIYVNYLTLKTDNYSHLKKISIKKIKLVDIKFIFNVYNSAVESGFFLTSKKITFAEHKNWFLKNYNSKKTKIYICFYKLAKIGYIRFDFFEKFSSKISIVIKKQFRKKGLASILLKNVTNLVFKRDNIRFFFAEVLKTNGLSEKFFLNNGYKLIKYRKKYKNIFKRNNFIFIKKIKINEK